MNFLCVQITCNTGIRLYKMFIIFCTVKFCIFFVCSWLIPHPVVLWQIYGSMECMYVCSGQSAGQELQNGRQWSWTEIDYVVPVETVRYSSSVICSLGEKAPAHSTVFNWVWSLNMGKQRAQTAVHEWYRNISKEWFRKGIWKLPRRWQQCLTYEGNMMS
jgi:hypothetical protein